MARGSIKTPEQKIAELEAEKTKYQKKIDGYKAKISELDQQISNEKEETELSKLMQALIDSGKTIEEVLTALNK